MSFKIAAFPKCFEYHIGLHRTMSVFEWVELAGKHLRAGLEGLELYDRFFLSLDRDYLTAVADAVHEAGFTIPMLICSPDFTHPDPGKRREAVEYEARMIETARFLGGEGTVCRILSGQQRPDISREQGVQWVIESIRELIPVARQFGIVLGMENHYKDSQWAFPEFALGMDVFMEIVNAVEDRANFGVQFDPSNALVAGDDPVDLLSRVKDRVVSMHASDRYFEENGEKPVIASGAGSLGYASHMRHGVIGKGLNDYDRIFRVLAASGFDGWVSIEDGMNGIEGIVESAEFLKAMRSKYFPFENVA